MGAVCSRPRSDAGTAPEIIVYRPWELEFQHEPGSIAEDGYRCSEGDCPIPHKRHSGKVRVLRLQNVSALSGIQLSVRGEGAQSWIPARGSTSFRLGRNDGLWCKERPMPHIALITYLVRDYEEAMQWFQNALGFKLFDNTDMGGGNRWVVVGPATNAGAHFLLAKAASPEQLAQVGKAAGGRVAFFLHTDDFERDKSTMLQAGVQFLEQPRVQTYGTVAVFEDFYGNRWDLLQPKN